MKSLIVYVQIFFVTISTLAYGQQPKLSVSNRTDQLVIMEYRPRNNKKASFVRESFEPDTKREIEIKGQDPFFVTHRLQNERTVQWKVYERRDVYLNELARRGVEWELDFTFHQDKRGNNIQVMSATLIPADGDEIKLFDQPNDDTSRFVKNIINRNWDTIRNAPDGMVDEVQLDFRKGRMSFQSNRFQGELRQMCIYEDDDACQINGRWWLPNGRQGEVYFTVSKQSPGKITGYCTLDGDKPVGESYPQYPWHN